MKERMCVSSSSFCSSSSSLWTLRLYFLSCLLSGCVFEDPPVKTVHPGDDIVLHCYGSRAAEIVFVKWIRPDLESEGSVFVFRDNQTFNQHPSFHGRVKLTDPQMKEEDASIFLKNINMNDTGLYECHVRIRGNCSELITIIHLQVKDSDHHQITVKTGHDVTLQGLDPRGEDVQALEWTRLDPEENVFVCKHGKNDCNTPHPSLKNRVKLMDPQMKDGNVSVILKNVTVNDAGIYECYVGSKGSGSELISSVHLMVNNSGCGAGGLSIGRNMDWTKFALIVALAFVSVLFFVIVGFIINTSCKTSKKLNHQPPADKTADPECECKERN